MKRNLTLRNNSYKNKEGTFCDADNLFQKELTAFVQEVKNQAIDEFVRQLKESKYGIVTNWDKPYAICYDRIDVLAKRYKENCNKDGE